MKFFKSLLLCFLFFGLGNFKAQSLNFNDSLKIMFLKKFDKRLKEKFSNKRVTIQSSKFLELEQLYSEKLNIIEEANTQPFLEKNDSQNFLKIFYSKRIPRGSASGSMRKSLKNGWFFITL